MAGEAALTRSMLVRFQPPEPFQRSQMEKRPTVNREIAGSIPAAGARLGPIEHQLVRRTLNPENRGQHSVGSLSRSSSGQDAALSMLRGGFDSRTGRDRFHRGVAQLGERSVRDREVAGSNPATPTHSAFRPMARTLARLARDEGSNPSGRTVMVLVAQRSERAAVNREISVRFRSITPSIARRRLW